MSNTFLTENIHFARSQNNQSQPANKLGRALWGFGGALGLGTALASAAKIVPLMQLMSVDCTNTAGDAFKQVICFGEELHVGIKVAGVVGGSWFAGYAFGKASESPKKPDVKSTELTLPTIANGHKTDEAVPAAKTDTDDDKKVDAKASSKDESVQAATNGKGDTKKAKEKTAKNADATQGPRRSSRIAKRKVE